MMNFIKYGLIGLGAATIMACSSDKETYTPIPEPTEVPYTFDIQEVVTRYSFAGGFHQDGGVGVILDRDGDGVADGLAVYLFVDDQFGCPSLWNIDHDGDTIPDTIYHDTDQDCIIDRVEDVEIKQFRSNR